jgi:hypothetical protein
MMELNVTAEDSNSITFGWTPPPNAAYYLFYSEGFRVSNAPAVDSKGNIKKSVKFFKSGEPYQVVCVQENPFRLDIGTYHDNVAVSDKTAVAAS